MEARKDVDREDETGVEREKRVVKEMKDVEKDKRNAGSKKRVLRRREACG